VQLKDGWSPKGKEHYFRYLLPPILNCEMPVRVLDHLAEFLDVPSEMKPAERFALVNTLRELVDQWIDSGKSDGIEEAWRRNIKWQPPTSRKPIAETLSDYRRRNPPQAETGDDGRFEILMLPDSRASTEPLERARDMAIYYFVCLLDLDSPMRERLSRCDGCGAYFVRVKAPKKGAPIYHGTFCEKCKHKGGARRTVDSRSRQTKEKIGWAADCWTNWTKRKGLRSAWIAEQVNRRVVRHPISWGTITGKWVTRHQKEIEAEVERRNNATRKD
jgi:hypothetical protein